MNITGLFQRLSSRWEGKDHWKPADYLIGESILNANIKKDIDELIKVVSDIDMVEVGKTLDSNTYTIRLIDSHKKCVTLWLSDDGKVTSITPY